MIDIQETLDANVNETKRRVTQLEKRMDIISENCRKLSAEIERMKADAIKKRSAEF